MTNSEQFNDNAKEVEENLKHIANAYTTQLITQVPNRTFEDYESFRNELFTELLGEARKTNSKNSTAYNFNDHMTKIAQEKAKQFQKSNPNELLANNHYYGKN